MALLPGIWAFAVPRPMDELIASVGGIYGVQGDDELEAVTLECINSSIDDANTHLWEFNKLVESGLPFTAAQSYVQVTANAYREMAVTLTDADGNVSPPLQMLPWSHFETLYGNSNLQGTPHTYSYRNLHREGKLYFFPTPPTSYVSTTDYTYNFEYYRRIPHADEEDPLQIPREIEQLITYGAKKRLAAHLAGASHPDVAAYAALEEQSLSALKSVDRRSTAETLRFRLRPPAVGPSVPVGGRLPYWWVFF